MKPIKKKRNQFDTWHYEERARKAGAEKRANYSRNIAQARTFHWYPSGTILQVMSQREKDSSIATRNKCSNTNNTTWSNYHQNPFLEISTHVTFFVISAMSGVSERVNDPTRYKGAAREYFQVYNIKRTVKIMLSAPIREKTCSVMLL